jgi:hypothetical protein
MRGISERSLGELRFGGALATARLAKVLAALAALGGVLIAAVGGSQICGSGGNGEDVAEYIGFVIGGTATGIVVLLAIGYGLEMMVVIFDQLDGLRTDIFELNPNDGVGPGS